MAGRWPVARGGRGTVVVGRGLKPPTGFRRSANPTMVSFGRWALRDARDGSRDGLLKGGEQSGEGSQDLWWVGMKDGWCYRQFGE